MGKVVARHGVSLHACDVRHSERLNDKYAGSCGWAQPPTSCGGRLSCRRAHALPGRRVGLSPADVRPAKPLLRLRLAYPLTAAPDPAPGSHSARERPG
jgi:hypothetical protein